MKFGLEAIFFMEKISSFIIKNIESINEEEIILTIKIGKNVKYYNVSFPNRGGVSFPDSLGLLLMNKDFNYHKQFLKILADYKSGLDVQLPINLFKMPLPQPELQAA